MKTDGGQKKEPKEQKDKFVVKLCRRCGEKLDKPGPLDDPHDFHTHTFPSECIYLLSLRACIYKAQLTELKADLTELKSCW
jgi:hypothetical protein